MAKERATPSNMHACKIPWTEEPGSYSPEGHRESGTTELVTHTDYKRFLFGLIVISLVLKEKSFALLFSALFLQLKENCNRL